MSLRAGLIGYGLAGRSLHAPLMAAAGIEIGGVVSSRVGEARADFPNVTVFASADDLCAAPDIQLVIIASPDHLHVDQARAALRAGKHVVIDKPFAPTSADALALTKEAEHRGLLLTVFHNRRWDNDFLTLRKLINAGHLGEVMHYAARWDRFRPNAAGGWREEHMLGELYGLGSHLVDQVLVLFGAPDWLQADVYKQRPVAGHNDGFELLMGQGRLRISLGVNFLAADELRSYRVLGTRAAFAKFGLDPQEHQLRARRVVDAADHGDEEPGAWGRLVEGATQQETRVRSERGDWPAFYRGVRATLESGAPPPVAPREVARVTAILEAALESSRTGQRIDVAAFFSSRGLA